MKYILCIFFIGLFYAVAFSGLSPKNQKAIDSLYPIATNIENPVESRLGAYNRCCWLSAYQDYNLCLKISSEYYDLTVKYQNVERQITALHFKGYACMMLGELDLSESCFELALNLARQHNLSYKTAEAYGDLGNLMVKKGDVKLALKYHLLSDSIAEKHNLNVPRARAKINLGEIYENKGQYKKSLHLFKVALAICEKNALGGYKSSIHEKLGDVNCSIKEFDKAMEEYHISLYLSKKITNVNRQISAMQKLGNLHFDLAHLDSALIYFQKAIDLSRKNEIMDYEASLLTSYARYFMAKGDLNEARIKIEESIHLFNASELYIGRDQAYFYAGEIYYKLKLQPLSNKALLHSFELAEKSGNLLIKEKSCKLLAQLYKDIGEYEKSVEFYEKYISYKDQRRGQDEVNEVLKFNIQSEFLQINLTDSLNRQKEVELLNLEHERFKEGESTKSILFYIGIGVLLLVLAFTIYSLLIRRKRAFELKHKNTIITEALHTKEILLKEVHHRVKNNMQVVSSLLMLKSRSTTDESAKSALIDSQKRIDSMLLAHQKMYRNNNFEEIEITEYALDIFKMLLDPVEGKDDVFKIEGAKHVLLKVEKAQVLGFVIHELVTNSIKYAWPDNRLKSIVLSFEETENEVCLHYADNGIGLSNDIDLTSIKSFGLKMIHSLIRNQLGGTIELEKREGLMMKITFAK
ncbi:MAG: hypothetical protein A3D31_03875 [Candidatus Fluviicola riflensis]|nr:MAG: hypothetical protein CHH17_11155 [Candidatus Fluviicola riflensis]OGS79117.1 MAG: hypothetical protein A3D31_03875 [Candidatus Fluviicola riflensis]OGS86549.1 MAG: hypothetical protein A2724_03335 [Fluviicola sp. RIFCSPHIGHO2_01_FULL_43_53]OGS88976.1 MAG: hypothetical protein A3E30_01325 [Fluviicola sp. RIFCSPHIGHO2_12_FULL_43_24]